MKRNHAEDESVAPKERAGRLSSRKTYIVPPSLLPRSLSLQRSLSLEGTILEADCCLRTSWINNTEAPLSETQQVVGRPLVLAAWKVADSDGQPRSTPLDVGRYQQRQPVDKD